MRACCPPRQLRPRTSGTERDPRQWSPTRSPGCRRVVSATSSPGPPAPRGPPRGPVWGALGELQRFLNTHAYSGRPDTLAVTVAHVDPDADDLAHLHRVREELRPLLLAGDGGAELPTRPTGPGTCSTVRERARRSREFEDRLIKSPLWSSLTTGYDPTPPIAGHDPSLAGPAVTSREAVARSQPIT